jgi:hypothetical protein
MKNAASRPGHKRLVIAGLDPAIHLFRKRGVCCSLLLNFQIQISNSHGFAFPRRRASWAFS